MLRYGGIVNIITIINTQRHYHYYNYNHRHNHNHNCRDSLHRLAWFSFCYVLHASLNYPLSKHNKHFGRLSANNSCHSSDNGSYL